jgi:hypothetical protein
MPERGPEVRGFDSIREDAPTTVKSDALVAQEEKNWDEEGKKALVEGFRSDTAARKGHAWATFFLLVGCVAATITIVVVTGCGLLHLSDKVLIALIAATAAKVIGLYWIVLSYLFPYRGNKPTSN